MCYTVALAITNTDSWLASDTSGSVFISAFMRASGSLDSRPCVTVAAGPVCGWRRAAGCPLSSSVSVPRFSSSLPLRLGSCSVGITDVTNVVAILFLYTMVPFSNSIKENVTVFKLHITNYNISRSDQPCASGLKTAGSPAFSSPANKGFSNKVFYKISTEKSTRIFSIKCSYRT